MDKRNPIPWFGVLAAVGTSLVLLGAGAGAPLTLGVLILWVGTLFLATMRAPARKPASNIKTFSSDSMGELIQHAANPLLLTERGKIARANRSAKKTLGKHIVGQDVRVAFRQPQAIALLDRGKNGTALVRGLVRRRDVWRMRRQSISDDLAVIELVSQSAEADISRAHTDFVANASHELRTPLASIIGYVETLKEGDDSLDSKTEQKFLSTVLREAKRLQNLVSDLMSLSRVEAEKHDAPDRAIELGPVVERAARDAANSERASRLQIDIADNLTIAGDEKQIEQLVRNLVDNAFKYGAEDTAVTVTLARNADNQAKLSVEDKGEGIAPEHIPHLTRRFYRTDPGRSRASGGTGLGLAIVKHITERHRGRLDIASEVGLGTTVIARFPLHNDE
ncbi:MAG: ATP-binding protein [Erythrobacter sp.]